LEEFKMTANIGNIDRAARLIIGLALFMAPLLNLPAVWSSAVLAIASMGVGVVLALTALVRFCPLYRIIGISTGKT
jgi:hypothetical protein